MTMTLLENQHSGHTLLNVRRGAPLVSISIVIILIEMLIRFSL